MNKIYKYNTATSENMHINKVPELEKKFNNTFHRTNDAF